MLRSTICCLFVGLAVIAVSAQPLDENINVQPEPATTTERVTRNIVDRDLDIEILRELLLNCEIESPLFKSYVKAMENAIRDLMAKKNYSAFTEEVLEDTTEARKAMCPQGAQTKKSSLEPYYSSRVLAVRYIPGPNTQETSENVKSSTNEDNNQRTSSNHR